MDEALSPIVMDRLIRGDIVLFDMWGQRCATVFEQGSELDWLTWLQRMWEKGWLYPFAVRTKDGQEYDKEQLRAMMGDL